ncbi:MAG: cytochrome P450 [Solirubrobacterales bacterium]
MDKALFDVPRLRRPAIVNAAQYWLAPEQFARRCQQLGDRFLVPMPAVTGPWLCLTDPEDIKRVFTADTDVLRLGAALAKVSAHHLVLGPTGLTNLDGPEHMRMRRRQLPPFHGRALPSYEKTMERKTEEALARWPLGRLTASQPHIEEITLEVMMATVFGVTDPERVERLRSATVALLREGHSRRFFIQTIIATSRENGWDRPFPRIRRAIDAVDAVVMEEVSQRRSEDKLDGQDVLGMFLRTPDEQGHLMSDNEICDAMRTLLLGGHDTTASTLTWVLERVSRSPEALARLEAAALDGDDEYLDAVIKETMRLRPAFPLTARLAAEQFELPGLTIPSGTMIAPYITLVHRRPELYPDPLSFRPERFLNTRAGTYSWIPFGGGPRRCIGAAFSLTEARIVLRTILRHVRIESSHRRSERVAHRNVFVVPARGGRITLQLRTAVSDHRPDAFAHDHAEVA